ncbi:MAG: asparaginyl-tRNA synthetase [Paraglaciecola sp.]|jgi:asparaginyl-tRNA synthetase
MTRPVERTKRTKVVDVLSSTAFDTTHLIKGWVRTKRESKNAVFIALNDGSTINNVQIVVDPTQVDEQLLSKVTTGASIAVTGALVESQGAGQTCEIQTESIVLLGEADPDKYPLQPKRHSMEFLREIAHLRPRTNTISAVWRIRHHMAFAVHQFFNDKGFLYLNTPILTASDAEGAGETFKVTTLDLNAPPKTEDGAIDYAKDFFGREANLTVSGQLEGELAALAVGEVYTFGPTFRAENSNTTRHLAEFWMIEPEMAFYDIIDNMDLVEEMLKYVLAYVMKKCADDLKFLSDREQQEQKNKPQNERQEMSLVERMQFIVDNDFERVTYTEAIDILKNSKPNKKKKFQFLIEEWGADLQSEHERFLVEKHFQKPVILYNYPKDIKSFYMRQNDDGKTVAAMDVLFPGIGEIVGGSQREERYEQLVNRMEEMDIPKEDLWWFLETRKFGTVEHSGFGLGFERLILFATGMTNIRDVIPFPRTPDNCEF